MVREDYIMRLIHEAVRMLLKLLFHIEEDPEEIEFESPEYETMNLELRLLVKEGKINEAENRLSELLDGENRDAFKLALLFYDELNKWEDEQLEAAGFSREEITEGLLSAARLYGYDGMVDALLEQ